LLPVFPLMRLLVSVFPFSLHLFFLCPGFGLAPRTTMFVVVPVVFEAGLTRLFEVLEGTGLVVSCCFMLANHVSQIPTQPHRICLTGLALGFGHSKLDEKFSLVILREVVDVQVLYNDGVLNRDSPLSFFLDPRQPGVFGL
jgi:hypothetical protein